MSTPNRFAAGTFSPRPRPAPIRQMIVAQSRIELMLLLRNGEQQLLTMFIPITLLIGLCLLPIGDFDESRTDTFVPAIMTVAVMSTAFTGQAIAVGFDRRYGALKRLGATPLPRWGVIVGKSVAVAIVVSGQAVVLGLIGAALGWRPSIGGLLLGIIAIAIGTLAFSAMGLLLGGTLKAEVVLALANLLWFAFIGIGSIVVIGDRVPDLVEWFARCTPSGALSEALHQATAGSVDVFGLAVLAIWGAAAGIAAVRYFRFT
ncbi:MULTISPECIES: ABC transporter permease [Williamsia]|uniref:ABC transporter permease n=1 Tax=Williamsia marianensis TaxID=85044 RepID=A0A2G3PPI5_WILMA|nr:MULTISPECIES: ABC transporter permease [Williamsia]ETD31931.1 multidrug ABC transporter permease [Williamsia sp. D3]MDV7135750.1 ABC transporter permease [Williamsia muralis]PHV67695.1 multidrug ABC transporter permease [Williamsia marianensis]PVY32645.1 ABC-2 type transport system permease protein [Williamsia marianensis]RKR95577.1 ABC-2 type transport system permease protein [Williamsia muralis]